jgi:hypothetical protein
MCNQVDLCRLCRPSNYAEWQWKQSSVWSRSRLVWRLSFRFHSAYFRALQRLEEGEQSVAGTEADWLV